MHCSTPKVSAGHAWSLVPVESRIISLQLKKMILRSDGSCTISCSVSGDGLQAFLDAAADCKRLLIFTGSGLSATSGEACSCLLCISGSLAFICDFAESLLFCRGSLIVGEATAALQSSSIAMKSHRQCYVGCLQSVATCTA